MDLVYRLHIDIPLGDDKEKSTDSAYRLTEELITERLGLAFKMKGDTTMSGYRLHIDIPVGTDEEEAIRIATHMVSSIAVHVSNRAKIDDEVTGMNYRLGHDDDRQKSNYFMKDEEGHVNNKKTRLTFTEKIL